MTLQMGERMYVTLPKKRSVRNRVPQIWKSFLIENFFETFPAAEICQVGTIRIVTTVSFCTLVARLDQNRFFILDVIWLQWHPESTRRVPCAFVYQRILSSWVCHTRSVKQPLEADELKRPYTLMEMWKLMRVKWPSRSPVHLWQKWDAGDLHWMTRDSHLCFFSLIPFSIMVITVCHVHRSGWGWITRQANQALWAKVGTLLSGLLASAKMLKYWVVACYNSLSCLPLGGRNDHSSIGLQAALVSICGAFRLTSSWTQANILGLHWQEERCCRSLKLQFFSTDLLLILDEIDRNSWLRRQLQVTVPMSIRSISQIWSSVDWVISCDSCWLSQ